MATEVSSRPTAERARRTTDLRAEIAHLSAVLDSGLSAVVGMDEAGRITLWSRGAERLFQWPRDEALGRTVAATIIPPRLRDQHERGLRRYLETRQSRILGSVVTVTARRRDGTEFPAELSLSQPVVATGGGLELVAFVRDVSDRLRGERLRAMQLEVTRILSAAPSLESAAPAVLSALGTALDWSVGILWMIDEDRLRLRQRFAWQAPGRDLGVLIDSARELELLPGEGLPGRIWADEQPIAVVEPARVAHPVSAPLVAAAGLHTAAGFPISNRGLVVGVIELMGLEEGPVDDTGLSVMADLGRQIGQFVEHARTAGELERAHRELSTRTAQLERAHDELISKAADLERSNTDLEQFARVASHDLQEPLRMVASYVQLLDRRYRGRLDADADEYVGFAVEGAKRMQSLIADLLAYSRSDSEPHALTMVETGRSVEASVANLMSQVRDSGARVTHGPMPQVQANVTQLTQVFQNLISNAIKFRGDEPPVIRIEARREGDLWLFSVRDNGIGLDSRHAEGIFQVFQRLHTRGEYPGTGIGLALCKKVVERLGGRIWVDSAPGQGATFHFTLPARL